MDMIARRQFLKVMAAALLSPQRPTNMLIRSARPEDLEMPLAGFSDFITPVERFFVRTHVTVPSVDIAAWRLNVQGHVSTPISLTMDDIRKMPSFELIRSEERRVGKEG